MLRTIKRVPWIALLLLFCMMIVGSWSADALKGELLFAAWCPVLGNYQWLSATIVTAVFFFLILLLYFYKDKLFIQTLKSFPSKDYKCVLILLSTPNIKPADFSFPLKIKYRFNKTVELKGECLEADIQTLQTLTDNSIFWNWQPLLRGLAVHRDTLKMVYLIGSEKSGRTEASFDYLQHAEMVIKKYFGEEITVLKAKKAVTFEELEALLRSIRRALKYIEGYKLGQGKKKYRIKKEDIVIDITGGQKITSIAGALTTLQLATVFQYVQTNDPYDVIAYDVVAQSPTSL